MTATLSVVVPTRDRARTLRRSLLALAAQQAVPGGCEVLVVDNGSGAPEDARHAVAEAAAAASDRMRFRLLREQAPGPAAARNRAIAAATAPLTLLLGDDTTPADDDLLRAHVDAHAATGATAAVLGMIEWSPEGLTPFMYWLDHGGPQFRFARLEAGPVSIAEHFISSHTSLATETLRRAGGFDERFPFAALEDIELGIRLAELGVSLVYRPDLVVVHDHPTDYADSLRRMRRVGAAAALLTELHPHVRLGGVGRPSPGKGAVLAVLRRLLLTEHELGWLPGALRDVRWRMAHLDAYYSGFRAGAP